MPYDTANYPTARLTCADRLCGIVALSDSAGHAFSAADWAACLRDHETLQCDPQEVLKREGENSVVVKTIKVGSAEIKVVVKVRPGKRCPFSFRLDRAARNFEKAVFLKDAGIAAEIPLAALRQKKSIFSDKSMYITEYVAQSVSLHLFLKRDLAAMPNRHAIKRQLARRLAEILAALHENGLWHRDAKPSNILVHKSGDGRYDLTLIDLDGIKWYGGLRTFNRRFRPFGHLAAIRLISPLIYTTDCLRTFTIYCNLTGIDKDNRKRLFRRLVSGLAAQRLQKLKSV
ncbi:MAG: lipopolysaccharide kinase InaA family protein [Sedimentisphaerales bacterium]|nr:lipopolysaccharide kinase InaA family protein [Sedimentisphaerales bacterium]